MNGPWRKPAESSDDLYPGLRMHDGTVSGSIRLGDTRLPLWAITGVLMEGGWEGVEQDWPNENGRYGEDPRSVVGGFLYDLLELRGEFGRLLMVLADAERCDHAQGLRRSWWETKRHRKRVGDQLRRCLAVLEGETTA